ncbi:hypothetical protein [Actinocrispum sp. NPDC049592]|uniref:hypothetical protein n=1 Tax=Actinocrispum sp. NPDC049592 TaxID=3154835 RepID=UPI00343A0664
MADITRQYPALAKVAARAAGAASAAVRFNVGHFDDTDREPMFDTAPPSDPLQVAGEMLATQIGGVGFRLHTWSPMTPGQPSAGVIATEVDDGLYDGSVVINPDFLYDSTHSTEILVTLGHDPWRPDFADSLMITSAYKAMTAAAGLEVPILFLQSPVAPYKDPPPRYRADGSGEAPRVSNGMALRMLIGLDSGNPRKRLALVRKIAWVAAEHGMGLQVTDRRFGRVRGEWWSVLRHEPDVYQRKKVEMFGWAPQGLPDTAHLLTFVGPARIGSSGSIASDLMARNVGVLAVSEVSLQEIAFINIITPVAPARVTAATPTGLCVPISAGLGAVARDCGLTRRRDARAPSPIGDTPACDYKVLRTGPVSLHVNDTAVHRPIWTSWEMPLVRDETGRTIDVPELVLAKLGTGGRVDYCRARISPTGTVRGRAKISAALDPAIKPVDVPDALSHLCDRAERDVLTHLVRHGLALHAIRLDVAWRERWVSR